MTTTTKRTTTFFFDRNTQKGKRTTTPFGLLQNVREIQRSRPFSFLFFLKLFGV